MDLVSKKRKKPLASLFVTRMVDDVDIPKLVEMPLPDSPYEALRYLKFLRKNSKRLRLYFFGYIYHYAEDRVYHLIPDMESQVGYVGYYTESMNRHVRQLKKLSKETGEPPTLEALLHHLPYASLMTSEDYTAADGMLEAWWRVRPPPESVKQAFQDLYKFNFWLQGGDEEEVDMPDDWNPEKGTQEDGPAGEPE